MRYILQEWDAVMEYLVALHDIEEIKKCVRQVCALHLSNTSKICLVFFIVKLMSGI